MLDRAFSAPLFAFSILLNFVVVFKITITIRFLLVFEFLLGFQGTIEAPFKALLSSRRRAEIGEALFKLYEGFLKAL